MDFTRSEDKAVNSASNRIKCITQPAMLPIFGL